MAKKKSIGDLAKELNISRTTVSFVLNGKAEQHKISKATQERVLKLVKEWNYKPNSTARNLRLGRTHSIGLVVPDISNPFFGKIARLLEEYASKHGYHVVFGSTDEKVERECEIVESMRQQGADGILLASADVYADHVRSLLDDEYPLVLFDREGTRQSLNVSSVVVENKSGMHQITKHLIDQGCHRIGLLTLTPDRSVIETRIEGYKDALIEAGLPIRDEMALPEPLDLVLIVAPLAANAPRKSGRFYEDLFDKVGRTALASEIAKIRATWPETEILVLRPDEHVLDIARPNPMSVSAAIPTFLTTLRSMKYELAHSSVWRVLEQHLVSPARS